MAWVLPSWPKISHISQSYRLKVSPFGIVTVVLPLKYSTRVHHLFRL